MTTKREIPQLDVCKVQPTVLRNFYETDIDKYRELVKNLTKRSRSGMNRLMARIEVDEFGNWIDVRAGEGKAQINFHGKVKYVHRIAWELWNGPIPEDYGIYRSPFRSRSMCPDHMKLLTLDEIGFETAKRRGTVLAEVELDD